MKRIGLLFVAIAVVLACLAANLPVESAQAKIVVEKSSFQKAFFMIYSAAVRSADIKEKGKLDAYMNYRASGQVEICFQKVAKDMESMEGVVWFCVLESAMDIVVDGNVKGMTITYIRSTGQNPEYLLLSVPTQASKEAWRARATQAYMNYLAAFYEQKVKMSALDILRLEKESADELFTTSGEPKIIYPD